MAGRADTELLEDLLAREQRLLSAYEAALRRDAIESSLGERLRDDEREHVRALEQTLAAGRRNPRASVPSPDLTAAVRDRDSFALFAKALEDETVGMYVEAAARVRDPALRRPLGSIMACGAAHVVALKDSLGIFLVN
jgi:rubrerythrin